MYQNLCNLKALSLKQGKYHESIKWGEKWEVVGEKLGYFKVYDRAVKQDWRNQVIACREANQFQKGIIYAKKLETYLATFHRSRTYDMVVVRQQLFELQYQTNNYKAALEILVSQFELIKEMYKKLQKRGKDQDQSEN